MGYNRLGKIKPQTLSQITNSIYTSDGYQGDYYSGYKPAMQEVQER